MENVFDLRAPPAVNGLVVVPHGEKISVYGRKELHDFKLHFVGILKLVHEYVAEPSAEILPRFLVPL